MAQLLLAWLVIQFPEVLQFRLYLVGDFGRSVDRMSKSLVRISPEGIIASTDGFAEAVQRRVEFTSNRSGEKAASFAPACTATTSRSELSTSPFKGPL